MLKKFFFLLPCLMMYLLNAQVNSKIHVYFTQSVNNNYSTIADGKQAANIEDTICAYINKANQTLDIAMYDNRSTKIVTAINAAYTRSVTVRYITVDGVPFTNTAISGLNSGINILKRSVNILGDHVMHNKFVIIDAATTNNAYTISGSMNFTPDNMTVDPNNVVIIQDKNLALAYTTEFEEMWGSNTAMYNTSLSKFGPSKTDNTPHSFTINGTTVELYFSPSDGTTSHINTTINTTTTDINFALFSFKNRSLLRNSIIALKTGGKQVKGIIENTSTSTSGFNTEYPNLMSAGVSVLSHESIANSFHHKYAIVDATNITSDPLVITGSHNWTESAESDYDENTLIIHNDNIANQYYEEFMTRYGDMTGIEDIVKANDIFLFPNPASDIVNVVLGNETLENIIVRNALGEIILETTIDAIPVSELSTGIYFLEIKTKSNRLLYKSFIKTSK